MGATHKNFPIFAKNLSNLELKIIGNKNLDFEFIETIIDVNTELEDEELTNYIIKELFSTGYFKSVTAEINSNILTINLIENPVINKIYFVNNERFNSDNKKGKDPKIPIDNQDNVVKRKACCKFNFLFSSKFVRTRSVPINTVTEADDKKTLFFSSYISCTKNGISINVPKIIRSIPVAKKTVLLLFIFESRRLFKKN